jgi:predicted RNA-binding Zn-ribbon protein involved in translation (DUF1610 family)
VRSLFLPPSNFFNSFSLSLKGLLFAGSKISHCLVLIKLLSRNLNLMVTQRMKYMRGTHDNSYNCTSISECNRPLSNSQNYMFYSCPNYGPDYLLRSG